MRPVEGAHEVGQGLGEAIEARHVGDLVEQRGPAPLAGPLQSPRRDQDHGRPVAPDDRGVPGVADTKLHGSAHPEIRDRGIEERTPFRILQPPRTSCRRQGENGTEDDLETAEARTGQPHQQQPLRPLRG